MASQNNLYKTKDKASKIFSLFSSEDENALWQRFQGAADNNRLSMKVKRKLN
jgi:hypothetical protein